MLNSASRARLEVGRVVVALGRGDRPAAMLAADDLQHQRVRRLCWFGRGLGLAQPALRGARGSPSRLSSACAGTSSTIAALQLAELERAEGDADQAHHRQVEMGQHAAHLAVLALGQRDVEPGVGALLAVEAGLDRAVVHALDGDAVGQRRQLRLVDRAMHARAVAPRPAVGRQLELARQAAVVGQQQQALGDE